MDKQKKTLLCMYVDDFCGIKEESFNFYIKRRYTIEKNKNKISRKSAEEIKDFSNNFWGIDESRTNVSAVTLLIGENGAGKTTLMRLLIKWLCQLSVGHIPQEKGALVISVDGEDKLIAFDGGKPWRIENNTNEEIVCIEDEGEIEELLNDIQLVYYTDTMTDLELSDTLTPEELGFLQDDSLLTRLSKLMEKSRYSVESVKDWIKREEFERQMKLFLYSQDNPNIMPEFPHRYMKLTALMVGDEKNFRVMSDGNTELIEDAINLWKSVFAGNAINNNLPDIAKALLWGLFSGTITSLFQWERTLPNLEKRIVTEQVRLSLRAYNRYNFYDWNTFFKRFFNNIFNDCDRKFRTVYCYEEFLDEWEKQFKDNINSFLDALKNIKNGDFWDKWMPSENSQNVWEFKLEYFNEKDESEQTNNDDEKKESPNLLQEWRSLWECYLAVAHLMPGCRFDWMYPSSGEVNKANLYCTMRMVDKGEHNNTWFLLDEPDNTFHPGWKRETMLDLLNICSIYDINSQLLISTHSPIMLSDMPKQAVILLTTVAGDEVKKQVSPKSSSFGQQIYTLFNDAFFMNQGVIGTFADEKINTTYRNLVELEENLRRKNVISKNQLNEYEKKLENIKYVIKLIDEPLLRGHLQQSYNWCSQRLKKSASHKKK